MTKITKPKKIVFRLDDILEARDMNPRQLSLRSGVNYRTVLKIYHNAQNGISLDTIGRICTVLDIAPGELLKAE